MNAQSEWQRFQSYLCDRPEIGLRLDISRMRFDDAAVEALSPALTKALVAMKELEAGAIANSTEGRMVGHYWLRDPGLAPPGEIGEEIKETLTKVKQFSANVHAGRISPQRSDAFYVGLIVGIGGSVLGPQFLAQALSEADDPLMLRFVDNTDPDGIFRTLAELEDLLDQTLVVVVSKSGETVETRNAMVEVAAAYRRAGLNFAAHAVAITSPDSKLHRKASQEKWLNIFPIWPWVGGRFSITSAVGLLPLALMGRDVDAFLAGAKDCDIATRDADLQRNPAARLAAMWHHAGNGRGERNLVVLPYCDRLELLPRYLQQLVMESVGKKSTRSGQIVHQGLTVLGNKGSTDQHSLVQQLRDGRDDFFVTFIEQLRLRLDRPQSPVESELTSGDYLHGFLHGTRQALTQAGRRSILLTLESVNERQVGVLAALFERTVGLYAELIDVNAYDQPGVEAGKSAAMAIVSLQRKAVSFLRGHPQEAFSAEELASALQEGGEVEILWHILERLSSDPTGGVRKLPGTNVTGSKYQFAAPAASL